jgi:SPP1 family predicted phage head-tail adaptor
MVKIGRRTIRIGDLDKRLTIQSVSEQIGSLGDVTETWSDLATVWGLLEPIRGGERYMSQQYAGHLVHRIIVRHRSDVTDKHRIQYGSRIFDVQVVMNLEEDDRFLEIEAIERGV